MVSRNINRLNETVQDLTNKYHVKAEVLQADLGTDEGIKLTRELINKEEIEFIVNNAGLGINKPFHATDLAEEVNLLNVLVKAPLELSHTAINQMKPRHKGFIVNVGSVAAWTTSGTYSAKTINKTTTNAH